ncbi:MAG: 4a-hydroxytetrahydrobiopterin dehydratase [Simkaniaceae bacterium]|nr:4a-hydroxytetrahydrobiopterin dehydratase [Candidatus Sacchlamyda saccharinae]
MSDLSKKKCVPCTTGAQPLKGAELLELFRDLEEGWECVDEKRLEKTYRFKDFKEALAFVNHIGKVAEEEGHHPDIELSWGKVKITLSTHKIKGLSEGDFILAAKCDVLNTSR